MRRCEFFGGAIVVATLVSLAAFGNSPLAGQAPTPQPGQAQQASAPAVPKPIEPPAPFVPEGFTAIFNGREYDRLAHQLDEPSRNDARIPRDARNDRGDAESSRPGGHPADRQEIPQRRSLHGGEARLRLRQRPVPAIDGGR